MFTQIITDELSAEDQLNDEVRDILDQYADYMRREGVSYQEMFRRIKNTLIPQRKIVRASGRDTGDQMKLSRDKITDISHKLVVAMRKARNVRLKKDQNDVRLQIVRLFHRGPAGRREGGPRRPHQDQNAKAGDRRGYRRVRSSAQALLRRGAEEARHRSNPVKPAIVVLGSLNMDFVVRTRAFACARRNRPGRRFPNDSGRQGRQPGVRRGPAREQCALVRMIGRVGYDMFADHLKASLAAAGVDVSAVAAVRNEATGVALIGWMPPDKTRSLSPQERTAYFRLPTSKDRAPASANAKYGLFQLETPLDTVAAGLRLAQREGAKTILDPAPAQLLSPGLVVRQSTFSRPTNPRRAFFSGSLPGRVTIEEAPALGERSPGDGTGGSYPETR